MMKKCFFLLLVTSLFAVSCSNNEDVPQPVTEDKAPLTILVYEIANNDLNSSLLEDVAEMYQGLTKMDKAATLLVYWDGQTSLGPNKSKHLILKYEWDGKGLMNGVSPLVATASNREIVETGVILKEYQTQLSTDKAVMAKVLSDMIGYAPTEKVGLVTASHGSAWIESIFGNTSRSFGQDGSGTDNTIQIADMADAMKSTGKVFEFLLFDACVMSTAEVLYDLRQVANYQIASVLEIPVDGFPYDGLMGYLYEGNPDGYKKACQSFIDYYKKLYDNGGTSWATITVTDSQQLDALTNEVRKEILEHKDVLSGFSPNGLQEYGWHTAPFISVDMEQFVKELNDGSLPTSFKNQLEKTVLYKNALEASRYYVNGYDIDLSNYCGIGMYVPVEGFSNWNSYFKTINWYKAAGWDQVTFSWNF